MTNVSIIIRTYNEERWIGKCLKKISEQNYENYEIVLVDNRSSDKTVSKAKEINPELIVTEIEEYRPGKALNRGIRESVGNFVVCLSAHCIPVDNEWLGNLLVNFEEHTDLAGVYARQLPTKSSSPIDKRDLIRTFGPEKRIQTKDSFFHNANSMVDKEIWEQYPFNEEVTNIEDQIWASEVINAGYKLVYDPEAAVFHYHGINQSNDPERTKSVVRTMENNLIEEQEHLAEKYEQDLLIPESLDIAAVLPLRQQSDAGVDSNKMLIQETLDDLHASTLVNDIVISADAEHIASQASEWGASRAYIRPLELSEPDVRVEEVFRYTLEQMEAESWYPDLIVSLDITHPFRPEGFIDDIIQFTLEEGVDSAIPVFPEHRPSWIESNGAIKQLNEKAVRDERAPIKIGLNGVGIVTYPDNIRQGERVSGEIGLYHIENPLTLIEIRTREDLKYWEAVGELWDELQSIEPH